MFSNISRVASSETWRYRRPGIFGAPAAARHTRIACHGHSGRPIAPVSPWQNGLAERLIGSIRRECLDHIIVLGEVHLRRILKSYARYNNETRTHLALDKDAPLSRTVRRAGRILCRPILGGSHHEYAGDLEDRWRENFALGRLVRPGWTGGRVERPTWAAFHMSGQLGPLF